MRVTPEIRIHCNYFFEDVDRYIDDAEPEDAPLYGQSISVANTYVLMETVLLIRIVLSRPMQKPHTSQKIHKPEKSLYDRPRQWLPF